MASNQRENARKERRRKKDAKTKKIIWSVLIFIIILLIILKVCEIDFTSVKNRFTDSDGNFSLSSSSTENNFPIKLDTSSDVQVNVINDKLNVLTATSVSVYNPSDANVVYSFNHGFTNPVIKCSGSYYCLFDQGSTKIRLDSVNENKFELNTSQSILTADVCKKGNVAFATRSEEKKSTVYVYDKNRNLKFSYDENEGYVVAVAIDSSGKKIAYAAVNSLNGQLLTTVYTINVGDDKPLATFTYEDTNVMSLHYSNSSDLYFVGDDCLSVISDQKEENIIYNKETVNTVDFCYTADNQLVYIYSQFAGADSSKMEYITDSGKIKSSVDLNGKVKYVSSSSNEAVVLFNDSVSVYSLTKGTLKESFTCDKDAQSVNKLSSKIFINRQQLVDLLSDDNKEIDYE